MKRETNNIRMDISIMISILNKKDELSLNGSFDEIKKILPDGVIKEIDDRRELDIRYNKTIGEVQIFAYDESHHNGNSYNEYFYELDLNNYLEETIQKILQKLHDRLYDEIFEKEAAEFLKEEVKKRINNKYNL